MWLIIENDEMRRLIPIHHKKQDIGHSCHCEERNDEAISVLAIQIAKILVAFTGMATRRPGLAPNAVELRLFP